VESLVDCCIFFSPTFTNKRGLQGVCRVAKLNSHYYIALYTCDCTEYAVYLFVCYEIVYIDRMEKDSSH